MAVQSVTFYVAPVLDACEAHEPTLNPIAEYAPRISVNYEAGHLVVKPADSVEDCRPRSAEEVRSTLEALSTLLAGQTSLEEEYFRDKATERAKVNERESRW